MRETKVYSEAEVVEKLKELPGWEYREGWIRRTYRTPGWPHTLLLANTIAFLADAAWHHPDLVLGFAQLTVKLQTHRVRGITDNDFALARRIDEVVLWRPPADSPLEGYPKKWIE
ncbi:MAG: 4a-hydroxytetrahydrobiopterin dehydratase [Gemmataceae bacterium]